MAQFQRLGGRRCFSEGTGMMRNPVQFEAQATSDIGG